MIYNPRAETLQREDLEQLQLERLQSVLNRVHRNVAFYRHLFDEHRVDPLGMKSLRDLREVPFTTREDLRRSYPYDMFAVPLRDVVRLHSTSGTTGRPIVVGYTKNDLAHWTECMARHLAGAGISEHDVIQIAFGFSLFTGGFGLYQGAEAIGASVIPSSREPLEKQLTVMRDYKTTALTCTPSFALALAAQREQMDLHPEQLKLRVGIFGAEPWSEGLRAQLEEGFHLRAFDIYGLTEVVGPGVAGECDRREGLHVNEDHFLVEVVDPSSGKPLPAGEEGELVFTTLTKEAFPLVRYRSGDLASLLPGPCACGRTLARISRLAGRTDDMVFFQGVKFLPSQVEEALLEEKGLAPHYRIVLDREGALDTVEIQVEVAAAEDRIASLQELQERVARRVEERIEVRPHIRLLQPHSLPRPEGGKARRVEDRRARA